MDVYRILATINRLTGETTISDPDLFQYVVDASFWLIGRNHAEFESLVFDDLSLTITPEPTTVQGLLLAYRAAVTRLSEIYAAKVDAGEIGRSWRSGLEADSSISLAKSYEKTIADLSTELEELILIKNAPESGARFQ